MHTEITELRGAREDGLAEGRLEGKRTLFISLLEQRFGSLTDSQRDRVRSSGAEAVEAWSRRLFDAVSVEDLLGRH
ncbi:MAG: DUF4351 domain-containing protein [Gammaproteobacteria bacterium]